MSLDTVFKRHKKIGLQFSGGKDSLACLFILFDYWDQLTVYWCNSGNAYPETIALMDKIRKMVPHFVEIDGRQPQTIKQHGFPSDLIPVDSSVGAKMVGINKLPLNDRYSCCYKSLMEPTHERMIADKVTLIIRGQKSADTYVGQAKSGEILGGFEMLYPVEKWTDEQVFKYLNEMGFSLPRFYTEGLKAMPDCMNCTAWLDHKFPSYIKKYHPEHYPELQKRLNMIAISVQPLMDDLRSAIKEE
jgi:3'-phosphoadenosine 5'-phosphosulfate sulfotransferase (PAPS reductase)/FAD synthetase